jgi:hypothetical protein
LEKHEAICCKPKKAANFVERKENKKPTGINCDECDVKDFASERGLKRHKLNVHEGEKRPESNIAEKQCEDCSEWFRADKIASHRRREHTNEKPKACSLCDERFHDYEEYRKHARNAHPDDDEEEDVDDI